MRPGRPSASTSSSCRSSRAPSRVPASATSAASTCSACTRPLASGESGTRACSPSPTPGSRGSWTPRCCWSVSASVPTRTPMCAAGRSAAPPRSSPSARASRRRCRRSRRERPRMRSAPRSRDCSSVAIASIATARPRRDLPKPVRKITVIGGPRSDSKAARAALERGRIVAEAVNWARDLVNTPARRHATGRDRARGAEDGREVGLTVQGLERGRAEEGWVRRDPRRRGRAACPPRMIELTYRGRRPGVPIALTGKGIAFDSGGLSIKDAKNMETMKDDMAGAASILATMRVLAQLEPKVNVDRGDPVRRRTCRAARRPKPGDVLTHRGGKTSEVLNTDAEGRLVLADSLAYLAERKPQVIIDTATLTGACMVALGEDIAGAMGNDAALIAMCSAAGGAVGEPDVGAPAARRSTGGRSTRASPTSRTSASAGAARSRRRCSSREFVGDMPWVHLDIAGPAFAERAGDLGRRARPASRCARSCATSWTARPVDGRVAEPSVTVEPGPDRSSGSSPTPTTPRSAPAAHSRSGRQPAVRCICWCSRTGTAGRRTRSWIAPRSPRPGCGRPRRPPRSWASPARGSLGVHDGELENTEEVREEVVRRIREVGAETVALVRSDPRGSSRTRLLQPLGPSPRRAASRWTPSFPGAGNPHFFSEHLAEGLRARGGVRDLARVDERAQPRGGHQRPPRHEGRRAREACQSARPRASRFFEELLAKDAREAGERIGVEHAEPFRVLDLR